MLELLDNVFWHTLTGAQARYAAGEGGARRYARGFSPIVAFADPARPDFAALARHCAPGEILYVDGLETALPAGWRLDLETTMFKMAWAGGMVEDESTFQPLPLRPQHAAQALALAELTRPGPFGMRTIELGDYFGVFEGGELVAMAGERSHAGTLREISGVCTHPAAQGRGFARKLMRHLIARQVRRGEVPFLHVMRSNEKAHALYARMGFRDHREVVVRVLVREATDNSPAA